MLAVTMPGRARALAPVFIASTTTVPILVTGPCFLDPVSASIYLSPVMPQGNSPLDGYPSVSSCGQAWLIKITEDDDD